jgi:Ca2+-binding RTX toxin-like protein
MPTIINGTPDPDLLLGTINDDIINGLAGNDTLTGGAGQDTLNGGDNDDNIRSDGDSGTYNGDAGNDTMFSGIGGEFMDGGTGIDLIDHTVFSGDYVFNMVTGLTNFGGESYINFENVIMGAGNDSVTGNAADNVINGGAGNDTLIGGAGNDFVVGGNGNDLLVGGTGRDSLYGEADDDGFDLNSVTDISNWVIDGGTGNDGVDLIQGVLQLGTTLPFVNIELLDIYLTQFVGTAGNDFYDFRPFNTFSPTFSLPAEITLLNAGSGADTVFVSNTNLGNFINTVNGNSGNDSLIGSVSRDSLSGGDDNDTLEGNGNNDTLDGGNGNDSLNGGAGNDSLVGGAGNDSLIGGNGNDLLVGDTGRDSLYGEADDDGFDLNSVTDITNWVIDGGTGNDGVDLIQGVLQLGSNLPFINMELLDTFFTEFVGTVGDDFYDFRPFNTFSPTFNQTLAIYSLNAGSGADTVFTSNAILSGRIDIGSYQNMVNGEAGNDSLVGSVSLDSLSGGDDNDTLEGNGDNDTLNGGNGNDSLVGGDGNDSLVGGAGNDTLIGGTGIDTLNGGNGKDNIRSDGDSGTYKGDAGNDIMFSGLGGETMDGGTGIDLIDHTVFSGDYVFNMVTGLTNFGAESYTNFENVNMGAGNDRVTGSIVANRINGGAGNDSLFGDSGSDTLIGGVGNDTLIGGLGTDRLTGNGGADRFLYNALSEIGDIITDFQSVDRINLKSSAFTGLALGTVTVNRYGEGTSLANAKANAIAAGAISAAVLAVVPTTGSAQFYYTNNVSGGTDRLIATLTPTVITLATVANTNFVVVA